MKTFITGATGFIGTHLANRLAQTKHKMSCLVRATSQVDLLKELGAELIEGDVTNKTSIIKGMSGCDWVVHLANIYSFWEPDQRLYRKVNVEGTQNIMECALETGVTKVIHISTALIYGKPADQPFTEESAVGPNRFSMYAQTKYEGDLIVWQMFEKKGLPLVVIYPGAVLGHGNPKATGMYIQDFIHRRVPARIFDDSVLTWVHVRDVAEGILKALEKDNNIGEKYLLGAETLSMAQFNESIQDISGIPMPKLRMPDSIVMLNAALLTWIADLTKKPPLWGMAADAVRMMKEGLSFDGSKAERELGLTYRPIRKALEEEISSYQAGNTL